MGHPTLQGAKVSEGLVIHCLACSPYRLLNGQEYRKCQFDGWWLSWAIGSRPICAPLDSESWPCAFSRNSSLIVHFLPIRSIRPLLDPKAYAATAHQ